MGQKSLPTEWTPKAHFCIVRHCDSRMGHCGETVKYFDALWHCNVPVNYCDEPVGLVI